MTNLIPFPIERALHSKVKNKTLCIFWGDVLICKREFKKSAGRAKTEYADIGVAELNEYFHAGADKYCDRRLLWVG